MTTIGTDTARATFTRSLSREDRDLASRELQGLGRNTSRESVMAFQRESHIKVDGIIGPQTSGALRTAYDRTGVDSNLRVAGERRAPTEGERRATPDGATPARDLIARDEQRRTNNRNVVATEAPAGATERQRFDHYAAIVRANGGQVNPNGEATVLGLRSRDGVTRGFEDRFVVLSPGGHVREFSGSTRPGNTTQRNGGVAELMPGNYAVNPHGLHYGRPSYHVTTLGGNGSVPAYRDRNGDGQYSAAERANPSTATGILFHVPNPAYNDRIPTSIGCLNIRNSDWNAFMSAVGGSRANFNFTLVNGR
jgi:hypothetical protein